jgi:hypothetical protein
MTKEKAMVRLMNELDKGICSAGKEGWISESQ